MGQDAASPAGPAPSRLTTPVIVLMSVATGLAVASNYYAQPLLHTISLEFGLSTARAGAIVTTAQLSYALGLLLLVPLGDLLERRRLIVLMTLLSACGLLLTASAQAPAMIFAGTAITALLSVVAQVLVPYAATLAGPAQRGRAVGTIMSGLLLGILLGRTAAGALADLGSWRTVYWLAAGALVLCAAALWRVLPASRSAERLSYPSLLRSVGELFVQEPLLRARALLGALVFAMFGVLWTAMTFLLAGPAYGYSDTAIGLMGLAGAAGALAATRTGRLVDRGLGNRLTRWGLLMLLAAWAPLALAPVSLAALVAGVLVLDMAIQVVHVTNQSTLYRIRPDARSRLTAAYMTVYFLGGAAGSLLSATLYEHAGWTGVCLAGAALALAALAYEWRSPAARVPALPPPGQP
ncbi:MFS transporter [Orrella sp. JC864]